MAEMKPWRMVEFITTATVTNPEVGPWLPNPATNDGHLRGASGPPAWGWRESNGSFHWEAGTPPAPLGVLCDDAWRPIPAAALPEYVQPAGGWHRSQVNRQKKRDNT